MILSTNRLALREITAGDAHSVLQLINSPAWLRHLGDRQIKTPEAAIQFLETGLWCRYKQNGFGMWRVSLRESDSFVGICGFIQREFLDHPDVGFAFLDEFEGRGYGFEAASAAVTYGFDSLGFSRVYAITSPANSNSIKLITKLGLGFDRLLEQQDGHINHLYSMDRPDAKKSEPRFTLASQ